MKTNQIAELPPLATVQQVAEYTQISIPTLARMRAENNGPAFLRIGRSVRYSREAVLAWLGSLETVG